MSKRTQLTAVCFVICIAAMIVASWSRSYAEVPKSDEAKPVHDVEKRAAKEKPISFNRDIKPILSNNCYLCHGPDKGNRKGGIDGMRLDTFEGATADQGGTFAIVPGEPEKSEILKRIISTDEDEMMPPKETHKKITKREIELLTKWIKSGAKYEKHWSYMSPVRYELPAVKNGDWAKNEIDRFILSRLEREGLTPSPEVDRYALIRRVSLDLTGLPPTWEEAEKFVKDTDPNAYEKLVDRLLASPAYGEHWAHLWLDLARYADSAGYAEDNLRSIWPYRDYVIRAVNSNMPFDRFTVEQIAGDMLPNATQDQIVASAMHRNTMTNSEGGTDNEEFRTVAVVDRVNTTMAVWMGSTIACAQCHDHKYDPLTQEEYFRMYAIFNNTADADRDDEAPIYSIYAPSQKDRIKSLKESIAKNEKALLDLSKENLAALDQWEDSLKSEINWKKLEIESSSLSKNADKSNSLIASPDGDVKFAENQSGKTTVTAKLDSGKIQTLRLLFTGPFTKAENGQPRDSMRAMFLRELKAKISSPALAKIPARFVLVKIPGKEKILSLAEVQVFQGDKNIAQQGTATQSSTSYDAPAKLAIDGNTSGRFEEDHSTTHTETSKDPWWELDLGKIETLDRLMIWNRTGDGIEDRLSQFYVTLLNSNREVVWEEFVTAAPEPSREFKFDGTQQIKFNVAIADVKSKENDAATLLAKNSRDKNGWAIKGRKIQPAALILGLQRELNIPQDTKLQVTLDYTTKSKYPPYNRVRISTSNTEAASDLIRTPEAVLEIVNTDKAERSQMQTTELIKYYTSIAPQLAAPREQIAKLSTELMEIKPDTLPVMEELKGNKRRKTHIQLRGNFQALDKEVTPGVPAVFASVLTKAKEESDAINDRLKLAEWLISSENPLTARVIANRNWEQIFGIGIVSTSEEFGAQGEQPVHPELLDWLATELVRLKWDMKAFNKMLVMSAAYRQSSKVTPDLLHKDPDNRLLARGPRFRMSAEEIRDQALAISGLLSKKMYGPPVKPPQPSFGLSAAFGGKTDWETSTGEDKHRRAIYTTWRRSNPYPSMATFDAPNRDVCSLRRVRTNTPLQALVTLNDPVYIEAAQSMARKIYSFEVNASDPTASLNERMKFAIEQCLTRPPKEAEVERLLELYQKTVLQYKEDNKAARKISADPLGPIPAGAKVEELAAWTVVSNVLLNLDEVLMKR